MFLTECKQLSQLIIMARDMGQPVPYETTQPLQVALLDIDDNEPVFLKPPVSTKLSEYVLMLVHVHVYKRCRVTVPHGFYLCVCVCSPQRGSLPYHRLAVPEHSRPGTVVGNVTRAVDADEGSNAIVYYFIAGKEEQHVGFYSPC